MKRLRHRLGFALALAVTVMAAPEVRAAQIVALDLKAVGGVSQELAASLTPTMIAELGRYDGISVVSQFELGALLEHEGNKQALGCDDASCMTTIAGALGAEMVLASTLAKVGSEWQVTLTLISSESAMAVRRSTGSEIGDVSSAGIAVAAAVANLFKDGLPSNMQGPGSMSRRGFQAVLLGFGKAVLDPKGKPKSLRRRLVLDLVNTELDFDVEPKMTLLDLAIRRGIGNIKRDLLMSKDEADLRRYLDGRDQWIVINKDLQRVKEVRKRARERGVAPSARPLRFEDPDPRDEPATAEIARYQKEAQKGRTIVDKAIKALAKRDRKTFASLWQKVDLGEHQFDREIKSMASYGYKYELLPFHATPPWTYESCISALDNRDLVLRIYLRKLKQGKIYGEDIAYMKRIDGTWKIRSW